MFYWIGDPTSWLYICVIAMCAFNFSLCVEYRIKGERLTPFYYYVFVLLFSIMVSDGWELTTRLRSSTLWNAADYHDHESYRLSWIWAARMVPKTIVIGLITTDFAMRRFWGKRLFDRLYGEKT